MTNKELIERAEKWLAVEAYFEDIPPLAQTNSAVAVNLIRDLLAALRPDIEAVERVGVIVENWYFLLECQLRDNNHPDYMHKELDAQYEQLKAALCKK